MSEKRDDHTRTFTEEIELAGAQVLERVRELIAEGNVRKLRVRTEGGSFLEIPLTAGVVAGGIFTLAAPWLAALAALAAVATHVKIEAIREKEDGAPPAEAPSAPPPPDRPAN